MSAKKNASGANYFAKKKSPQHPVEQTPAEEKRSSKNEKDACESPSLLQTSKWRTHSPPVKPPSFPAWTWKVHHLPISGWISCCNLKEPSSSTCPIPSILLMVQKSQGQPPGMWSKHCKSWDFNYQPPSTGFCLPDFWLPSTVGNGKVSKGKIRWQFSAADPWRCPCTHTSTFHCPTSEEHLCTLSIL